MRRIALATAAPGQILAEKLTRHDGVLLANQGAEVTEGLLRMLARQNVETIMVEESDSRTPEEVMADYQRFRDDLDTRFVRADSQPVLMALKKTMIFIAEKDRDETLALLAPLPSADPAGSAVSPPQG
ncbi:MAG: hypothetical protein LBP22_10340 [Deltaproteobacteria bacterium]|nr:hypothetical protein [Deltaproteobacteria bacterium]